MSELAEHEAGHTKLMRAALDGEIETAKALLESGADMNDRDDEGRTAVRRRMQHIGILVILLSLLVVVSGCGVAKRATRSPETDALLRAARAGNADTVRALLASPNIDVNGIDEHGNTPIIEAARFGHDEVVTALLMAKANVKTKNDEGKTALMLAAEGGHDETVRVLTQAGAER